MSKDIGSSEMMTYAHYKRQRDEKREDARIQKKKDDRNYVMKSLMQGIEYGRKDDRNAVRDAQSDRQFKLQETELQQQQSTNIAKTQAEMNTSYRTELKQKQSEHAAYVKGILNDPMGNMASEGGSSSPMGFDQWVNLPDNKMKQKYTSIEEARRFYNDPQGYTGATSNDGLAVDGEIDDAPLRKFFDEDSIQKTDDGELIGEDELEMQSEELYEDEEGVKESQRKQKRFRYFKSLEEQAAKDQAKRDAKKLADKRAKREAELIAEEDAKRAAEEEKVEASLANASEEYEEAKAGRDADAMKQNMERNKETEAADKARNAPSDTSPEEEELQSQTKYEGGLGKKITQQKKKAFEEKEAATAKRKEEILVQKKELRVKTSEAAKAQEEFAEKRTSDFVKKHGGDDKRVVSAKAENIPSLAKLVKNKKHYLKLENGELTKKSLRKLPGLIKKDPELWESLSRFAKAKIIQAMKKTTKPKSFMGTLGEYHQGMMKKLESSAQ
jgi:hypothetical protein